MPLTQNNITPPLDLIQASNIERVRGLLYILYSHVVSLTEYFHREDEKDVQDNAFFWITEQFGLMDAKLKDVETYFCALIKTSEIDPFSAKIRANYEAEKAQARA